MKRLILVSVLVLGLVVAPTLFVSQGQAPHGGTVLVPASSQERPGDVGLRAHTNHLILVNPNKGGPPPPPPPSTPAGETPQSIRPVYNLPSTGGNGVIAVVDAFDYPTAENDLNVFSAQFALPPCTAASGCFRVVYASGVQPRENCSWAQEAALDIEWAHAMAPNAKIVLVEAASNFFTEMFQAVDVASNIVNADSVGGEVSMSWGGSEFSSETTFDSHFTTPKVVYFAASGDIGGATIYPGVSPGVVCAGGTTINRDSAGNFVSETGWSGSGGGPSLYELRPSYQDVIVNIVGSQRGAPDFSFDADPNSGVAVYDSTPCEGLSGWLVFGGTSVSSPSLAGIVNLASHFYGSTDVELSTIYADYASPNYSLDFRDIVLGAAGSFTATTGWDFVTGVGSNQGLNGK